MLFQLQNISLIHLPILFNCILSLYPKISELSLTKALIISLHSGIALATTMLWNALDRNNFYFPFSFIFWLYRNFVFFFFFFSFGWWRGTWHCSHMTYHMMWCHRPRRWWKDLEDDVRAHVYNMVTLRQTWGRGMDIRVGLSIGSTDQACFVYIGL